MNYAKIFGLSALILSFTGMAIDTQASETLTGTPEIVDGKTIKINGKTIVLADIVIPQLGTTCIWKGKERPCGKLSKAGLQDITVASTLMCSLARAKTYRCVSEDDFDVGFGQIHAGWAVPAKTAPAHYRERTDYARSQGHGLWTATTADGSRSFLETLAE